MKKILLLSFCLFLFLQYQLNAQTTWSPIGLDVVGHNKMNGVEASYQLGTCNGNDVVFIKLINQNSFDVTVEWYPAVFTNTLTWIKKETPADKKSIDVNSGAELTGDCSASNPSLMILLNDFPVAVNNFIRFGTTNFTVYPK